MFNNIILNLLQGEQGEQGKPGPFEYVEPNPEDCLKGEKVKRPYVKQVFSCWGPQAASKEKMMGEIYHFFCRGGKDRKEFVDHLAQGWVLLHIYLNLLVLITSELT